MSVIHACGICIQLNRSSRKPQYSNFSQGVGPCLFVCWPLTWINLQTDQYAKINGSKNIHFYNALVSIREYCIIAK